ncbi:MULTISPECIES: hypothetical protein [unclassified Myroides]|uniref:hypothetical protein n=1 Tax=unclassified Myroides TaxID=2642485 RepID=UPI003D2F5ABE
MSTKLIKSLSKTMIVSDKAKLFIAERIDNAIENEPQREKELKQTATLLGIYKLLKTTVLN